MVKTPFTKYAIGIYEIGNALLDSAISCQPPIVYAVISCDFLYGVGHCVTSNKLDFYDQFI